MNAATYAVLDTLEGRTLHVAGRLRRIGMVVEARKLEDGLSAVLWTFHEVDVSLF